MALKMPIHNIVRHIWRFIVNWDCIIKARTLSSGIQTSVLATRRYVELMLTYYVGMLFFDILCRVAPGAYHDHLFGIVTSIYTNTPD
jgi:hypothetical protein